MHLIEKLSSKIAKKWATELENDKEEVYDYELQIIIGSLFDIVPLVLISLPLHIMLQTTIVTITFAIFRFLTGGFHMDTYNKCITTSTLVIITSSLLSKLLYQHISMTSMIILISWLLIITVNAIETYLPVINPNNEITDPKAIQKLKRMALIYIIVWLILEVAFTSCGYMLVSISMWFGVFMTMFMTSKPGYFVFGKLSKVLDLIWKDSK